MKNLKFQTQIRFCQPSQKANLFTFLFLLLMSITFSTSAQIIFQASVNPAIQYAPPATINYGTVRNHESAIIDAAFSPTGYVVATVIDGATPGLLISNGNGNDNFLDLNILGITNVTNPDVALLKDPNGNLHAVVTCNGNGTGLWVDLNISSTMAISVNGNVNDIDPFTITSDPKVDANPLNNTFVIAYTDGIVVKFSTYEWQVLQQEFQSGTIYSVISSTNAQFKPDVAVSSIASNAVNVVVVSYLENVSNIATINVNQIVGTQAPTLEHTYATNWNCSNITYLQPRIAANNEVTGILTPNIQWSLIFAEPYNINQPHLYYANCDGLSPATSFYMEGSAQSVGQNVSPSLDWISGTGDAFAAWYCREIPISTGHTTSMMFPTNNYQSYVWEDITPYTNSATLPSVGSDGALNMYVVAYQDANGVYYKVRSGLTTNFKQASTVTNKTAIYPNPCQNVLNVQLAEPQAFTIYNAMGMPIFSANTSEPISHLDVKNLKAGTYFIQLKSETIRFSKL